MFFLDFTCGRTDYFGFQIDIRNRMLNNIIRAQVQLSNLAHLIIFTIWSASNFMPQFLFEIFVSLPCNKCEINLQSKLALCSNLKSNSMTYQFNDRWDIHTNSVIFIIRAILWINSTSLLSSLINICRNKIFLLRIKKLKEHNWIILVYL